MRSTFLLTVVLIFALVIAGCVAKTETRDADLPAADTATTSTIGQPAASLSTMELKIFQTNVSEDLILELTPKFRLFREHLQGDSVDLSAMFVDPVSYQGIAAFDLLDAVGGHPTDQNHPEAHISWPLSSPAQPVSANKIWAPLLKDFKFEDTQFGVVSGVVLPGEDVFQVSSVFEGRIRDAQQRMFGVKAKQTMEWVPTGDGQWKIRSWVQETLEIVFAPKPLFVNVTKNTVPEPTTLDALTRSEHEELILEKFETGSVKRTAKPGFKYFNDWESTFQFPAACVTDIDQDGWDDVFIVDRWGKSILLRNQKGRTFEDVSQQTGLEVDESASCSLFVDFDNDGDSDVFVGGGFGPSLFFRNVNGKFSLDEAINRELSEIRFVTGASVADVNRDGLLDIYLCTYCYSRGDPRDYLPFAVRYEDEVTTLAKIRSGHRYLHRGGPPNILLMNRGGNLELVEIDDSLKQWLNSYQSVWYDADRDGDQDLYVCNDFAADVFLRNDTPQGSFEPRFTDVSADVFPDATMGFGMGASLGDYNNDGQTDLYVSNMYSKAGLRIVQQMGGEVDPRILVAAQGNFLYENQNGKFTQVAGLKEGAQHVSKVGWSFGGQLADLNNDGQLDLYVPSGYFSAPPQFYSEVDL